MKTELIVALDVPTSKEALDMVHQIGSQVQWYKVGLELFLNSRGDVVDQLKALNKSIFLDLKFHDIPNTTAQACHWAASLGVDMFNVHALGGEDMMKRSVLACQEGAEQNKLRQPLLMGVTVLTSMNAQGLNKIGIHEQPMVQVIKLAKMAQSCGLDGVVCSSQEVDQIYAELNNTFLTVCPGIRPSWAVTDDQSRIMTPREAYIKGVSYMVVGRPISKHSDPALAAQLILNEINV